MSNASSSKKIAVVLAATLIAGSAHAQKRRPPPPTPPAASNDPAAQKKEEARARFEKAMTLFDKKLWDAALAEFLESRAAYPTRSNTQNAAICLQNLNRFDESLDMFETLVKEFKDIPDRAAVDKEIETLRGLVGSLEVKTEAGAQISVDGRERGFAPLAAMRVATGSHVVRIYKDGSQPFEKRVEVAGRQSVVVDGKLEALGVSGRLSVTEDGGKGATVVVDGIVVGKTPWQGPVTVGDHVVFLRGEGNVGTQPASASVHINQVTPIVLALEALECPLRVTPVPSGASVAIDGVVVGAGLWDGRLRKGLHKIEIAQTGFVPESHQVDLVPGHEQRLDIRLERDPSSPLWQKQRPALLYGDISPSFPIAIALGGDVASGGSASFPLGVAGRAHVGYELPSGIGFGLTAGYLYLARDIDNRDTVLRPVGKAEARGSATDHLSLKGLLVGASAHLHRGDVMPLLFRVSAGVFLADAADRRDGSFAQSNAPALAVATRRSTDHGSYLYLAPEVRVGWRVAEHIELTAGADITLMVALSAPRWDPSDGVVYGNQGLATYPSETLAGSAFLLFDPNIGARFEF